MAPPGVRLVDQHTSVRARSRHDPNDPARKTVYKPVLDNPLSVNWPPLPASVRRAILDELLALFATATTASGKGIADWRLDEHALRRGNKRGAGAGKGKSKARDEGVQADKAREKENATRPGTAGEGQGVALTTGTSANETSGAAAPSEPALALLSHLVIGINEVTRALESRIRWGRWELGDRSAAPSSSPPAPDATSKAERTGRHRRRKPSSTTASAPAVIPSSSAHAPQPLPLADHPAYSFVHARAPAPSANACPPYVVTAHEDGGSHCVRLLVNSDARRIKRLPRASPAAHLPTHPNPGSADTVGPIPPPPPPPTVPLVDLIFVCRPDINPPSLVAHLPTMVAAANGVQSAIESVLVGESARGGEEAKMDVDGSADGAATGVRPEMRKVLLVPLDVGAERKLADALGLRRVAAIGLSSLSPAAAPLLALIASHLPTPLSAPWLVPHLLHPPRLAPASSLFAPTTIKHLKTTAPLNPRAAITLKKEQRRKSKDEQGAKRRRTEGDDEGGGDGDVSVYVAED